MASASEETMVHYGVALSGQASSAACYNPVSFRKAHFDKHIRGALHSSVQPGAKALKVPFNVDLFDSRCKKIWEPRPDVDGIYK